MLITLLILKIYTNHGQKLELPDYVEMDIDQATLDAKRKSFKIIVNDSIHRLGVPGGQILIQNPKATSKVKENRKIYVTIAKHSPDFILSQYLPELYGRNFEMKRRELENQQVYVSIKDFLYDNAEPNTILEVWYKGKQIINRTGRKEGIQIDKGSTLDMVLSKNYGGTIIIPDLTCKKYSNVDFIIHEYKLKIDEIIEEGPINDLAESWVIRQLPESDGIREIQMGESMKLYVSQQKPSHCN